ncbi:prophage endopeptidase tail [Clostridium sporogenes]|uniref:phage tail spike protein n=1 Tax=Clostridium botulinum TaxID=1491 RepID=UPI0007178EAE|nr:phage tail spike protein [Clostridium botulinum]KRU29368.1 prophage endopeptidase tail [Clostridium sporogenes]KRU33456.1 prophage endopeptidase tail [Clostridium sporogenes]KRU33912.1 prophage endopeptidase tail [Clostridium sporogenes]KRU43440.1 prophage endopeptidase tail [Clostridium sporogenes]MBZ1330973.1 phage tail protein [Clostridium botulinum]
MIKIFEPNSTNFNNNGLTVLTNAIDPEIIEELNGAYSLSFKYSIEDSKVVQGIIQANNTVISRESLMVGTKGKANLMPKSYFLQKDYIVYANNQPFRIYNVKRDMSTIEINCRHIFYDLLDNFLEDVRPTNLNRMDALQWVLERTQYPNGFTFNGNIGPTATRYFIRKNVVEAIMGQDGILETWGGEIVRDNFNIGIWDNRGNDRGVLIQGGKNLLGIEDDLNTDNVVTRIMPTGLDENDTVIMLPEKYIDSPNINMYPHPKVRHLHYGDIKVNGETGITKDDVIRLLRLKVKELYEVEKVDIPEVNYKVDFIELSKTEEYKDYISLEKVEVGDTVTVRYNKLNLDIKAKVIKTTKRLKGKTWLNEKVELGNFKNNVSTSLNKIDAITTDDGKVKGEAIWGTIDATKASLKAMADSAETQVERAIIFEDKDPDSPTYGAMCLGTRGFQIAREMTNDEWQWTTFGTGQGFTADLIRAGILQSLDGTLRIDLGGNTFRTYNWSGFPALEMENMNLSFYDFKKNGEKAGMIYTHYQVDYPDKLGISITHYPAYDLGISYYNTDTEHYSYYITFDKYKVLPITKEPITIREPINASFSPLKFYYNDQLSGFLGTNGNSDLRACFSGDDGSVRFGRQWSSDFETYFRCADYRKNINNVGFVAYNGAEIQGKTLVFGDFSVTGKKNCVIETKDYGKRLMNAYETLGYYFGDLGSGTVGEDGTCYVEIRDIVTQLVNTDIPYHVTYTEIVPEDITEEEMRERDTLRLVRMESTYFVMKGEPGAKFTWELKAKRREYENDYAEEYKNQTMLDEPESFIDFDKYEPVNLDDILLKIKNIEDDLLGGN